MEICTTGGCPFAAINWIWYIVAVIVTYGVGILWYGPLFSKPWIKAVGYKCTCGADLSKGEKCTCESQSFLPMILQFITNALVGLMYFIIVGLSFWYAILVAVAIMGWMKSTLLFKTPNMKQFITLAFIEIGYFFVISIIYILFALI